MSALKEKLLKLEHLKLVELLVGLSQDVAILSRIDELLETKALTSAVEKKKKKKDKEFDMSK